MKIKARIKEYYRLAKPGIVYGNALVAAAGFLYVAHTPINWLLFLAMLVGLSLVMASACVCNNYADRDIDAAMVRTRSRPLVAGTIPLRSALIYGASLGIVGGALLFFYTTFLAFAVALVGFVLYVFLYTPLKHVSAHALWVGAVAGATPPVVGYVAITNSLDTTALWFFIFLFIWQVPHFLAIAVYRFEEYHAAGVPLFIKKAPSKGARKAGRLVFYASLVVLLVWCAALMLHR